MHRQGLLKLLERYRTSGRVHESEHESLARMVEFVNRCPDCFERTLLEGHVTGASWLLNDTLDACLLTHHRKLGKWLQLGGHADGDSDVMAVALREAGEESGIEGIEPISHEIFDVDVHPIPERGGEPAHFHYDVRFVFRAPRGAKYRVSSESHDLRWVAREEVLALNTDESVMRMVRKWTLPPDSEVDRTEID